VQYEDAGLFRLRIWGFYYTWSQDHTFVASENKIKQKQSPESKLNFGVEVSEMYSLFPELKSKIR
jgi:hypothetical protein